jgi:hypothetical protein
MGFRMTVFSEPAQTEQAPTPSSTAFFAIPNETVAFGYRARALVFEQRVRRPLAIRDMRRFV